MTETTQGPQSPEPRSPGPQSPGAPSPGAPSPGAPSPGAPSLGPQSPGQPGAYPPPGQAPGAYPPPAAYGPPEPGNDSAVIALILGIVGIVMFPPVAPFAWWQGVVGKRNVDRGETTKNRGMAVAGQVLGIVGSVLLALYVIFVVVVIIVAIASAPTS